MVFQTPHSFTHTRPDGIKRVLECHDAVLALCFIGHPEVDFALIVEGTEPGMGMDDDGAPGWVAPVRVEIGVSFPHRHDMTLDGFSGETQHPAEGFDQLVTLEDETEITVMLAKFEGIGGRRVDVDVIVQSEAGEFIFRGILPVRELSMAVSDDAKKADTEARAKAFLRLDCLPTWEQTNEFGHGLQLMFEEG